MEDERVISYERGKQLADQLGLEFFETSAKENINVKVFILFSNKTKNDSLWSNVFVIRPFSNVWWTLFATKCPRVWTAIQTWWIHLKERDWRTKLLLPTPAPANVEHQQTKPTTFSRSCSTAENKNTPKK